MNLEDTLEMSLGKVLTVANGKAAAIHLLNYSGRYSPTFSISQYTA